MLVEYAYGFLYNVVPLDIAVSADAMDDVDITEAATDMSSSMSGCSIEVENMSSREPRVSIDKAGPSSTDSGTFAKLSRDV